MGILKVQNFLSLKNIEIAIKPFTVLIGPQATGKSLIAKLVYIFNHIPVIVDEILLDDSHETESTILKAVSDDIEKLFVNIFPAYAWKKNPFLIQFSCQNTQI